MAREVAGDRRVTAAATGPDRGVISWHGFACDFAAHATYPTARGNDVSRRPNGPPATLRHVGERAEANAYKAAWNFWQIAAKLPAKGD